MVEIVDHHRVGDVQTSAPVLFLNLPVGATATIVATRYEQLGVEIPGPIAAILLSAVLTDTVLLKSPTTTDIDRRIATELGRIAGLEPLEFGMEVFKSRMAGEVFSAKAVVGTDAKEFHVGRLGGADRPARDRGCGLGHEPRRGCSRPRWSRCWPRAASMPSS